MSTSDYAADVFRFGSANPFVDADGRRRNLCHNHPAFRPEDVKTDGIGNVLDMPVLLRKPCFGRPEVHLRQGMYGVRKWTTKSGEELLRRGRCQNCPVEEACAKVVIERIESDAQINLKYCEFDESAQAVPYSPFSFVKPNGCWIVFLQAIVAHGGWSNVNDDRARAKQLQLSEDKRAKDNERRRATRRAARSAGILQSHPMTSEEMQALCHAASERLGILIGLLSWREGPRWITKLSTDRCVFTVDVWIEMMTLERGKERLTSKAVAQRLIRDDKDRGLSLASLTTRVNEARKRIQKLEDDRGGNPVWPKFAWP